MSRLIDADALKKKATVVTKYDEGGWGVDLLAVPLCDVELAPTVEAEPVIRCKNCRHYKRYDDEIEGVTWQGLCKYGEFFTDDLDFCSRAKTDKEE